MASFGLRLSPLTNAAREQLGIAPKLTGVLVGQIEEASVAADHGIVVGNLVTRVGTTAVTTPAQLPAAIGALRKQEQPVALLLVRGKDGPRWVALPLSPRS